MRVSKVVGCFNKGSGRIETLQIRLESPSSGNEMRQDYVGPHPNDLEGGATSRDRSCGTIALESDEEVTKFDVWYSSSRVDAVDVKTSKGREVSLGSKKNGKKFEYVFNNQNFELIGFYGKSSSTGITNLGLVVYKSNQDCTVKEEPVDEPVIPEEEPSEPIDKPETTTETDEADSTNEQETTSGGKTDQNNEAEEEDGGSAAVWIIIVVVVAIALIIAIVVCVLVARKKVIEEEEETPKQDLPNIRKDAENPRDAP